MFKKVISMFTILLFSLQFPFAEDKSTEGAADETGDSSPVIKIKPVLPQVGSSIIFIEGEDAVATNFNREPILNYSSSGYRTLQLNQATGLQGKSVYYADYVFYVEEDSVYEFWYGGTPPGNKDELLPSFSSPFHYRLDSYYEFDVYREDVDVIGGYAPAYYWNYVSDITLTKGEHRITFEIPERRSFDGKFFFYLDNFFFVKKVNDVRILEGEIPSVFPDNMDDRTLDFPFKPIEDYEILIRDNPEQSWNYIEISMIYSLIGDYLNSLKNLRKALLLEPDDPYIMLLIAKNLIWKGSFQDGLYLYSDLLKIVPERIDILTEAGKIAAWIGQYESSVEFFLNGTDLYPENLSLQANLGITHLWSGDSFSAEKQFELVNNLAGDDLLLNKELAEIFEVNGYPDKSIEIYKKIINLYPEDLETRFFLEDAYIQNNQHNKIELLREDTAELYETSPEFEKALQTFYNKQVMKEKVIADYEEELDNDPDNLILRKTLAEIYFWNGDKKKAISEYLNILTNYTYRNLRETERSVVQYYEIVDRNYALKHFLDDLPAYITSSVRELNTNLLNYKKAVTALGSIQKKNEAAKVKGKEPDLAILSERQNQLKNSEDVLASGIAAKENFVEKYQFLMDEFAGDTEYLLRLISDETSINEAFGKLTKGSQWEWDRSSMLRELEKGNDDGLNLAAYVIGKIYQLEGDTIRSAQYIDSLIESEKILEDAPFAVFQNSLWLGDKEKLSDIYENYSEEIVAYDKYLYDIVDYIDYLSLKDDEINGFLTEDPSGSVEDVSDRFSQIKSNLKNIQIDVQKNITSIHKILEEKMQQSFYRLAEQTYLLRNELGDFYQNEGQFPEAIEQYRQVLKIDPWNLSAKYKLGQVYQWNGNWQKALDLYEEVYEEDPVYGNVTFFYNQLARAHSDKFSFLGRTTADPWTLKFESQALYSSNIYGIFSFGLDYKVSNNRNYRDGFTYLLQDLSLQLPIDLSPITLSPFGGIYAYSNLIDDTFTGIPTIGDLLGEYNFYPYGGVSMSLWKGPFGLSGIYEYNWKEDSFKPGVSPVSYHKGEVYAQVDFNFIQLPVIKETTVVVSGISKYLADSNIIYSGSFELLNDVELNKNPDISLNFSAKLLYEDSTLSIHPGYWAPVDSLTAGLGIGAKAIFSLDEKVSLGDAFNFGANYYSDNNGSGIDYKIGNIFEYVNGNFDGYLKFDGTFRDNMEYWSISISIGSSSLLPELLTL